MALWTSVSSWLFWGWNDWHVLTPSGTWFLRSLVRFFLLRFSLFASDEMQLSDCSTWHLVCWLLPFYRNLYRDLDVYQDRDIGACFVCIFFVIGPAPLSDLSVSYSSSERARISVHIFCLFCRASLSIAMLCYFRPKQCKKQKKFRKINMILKRGRACTLCKNKQVWESHRKSIKLTKPTNLGFHLQKWDTHHHPSTLSVRIYTYLYYIYNIHIRLHLLPICTPVLLIILASIGYYCILLWWLASYPLMLLGNNMPHAACLNIDDFVTSIRDPCPLLCLLRSQAHPFPHRLLWPESAELIVHLLALKSC